MIAPPLTQSKLVNSPEGAGVPAGAKRTVASPVGANNSSNARRFTELSRNRLAAVLKASPAASPAAARAPKGEVKSRHREPPPFTIAPDQASACRRRTRLAWPDQEESP